jgi:ribosome assembly protein 1
VSTAARLCDGALLVVDAVEGVCIQTHAVLRQAWEEKVRGEGWPGAGAARCRRAHASFSFPANQQQRLLLPSAPAAPPAHLALPPPHTQVKPCLFLNKLDRLILELRMTPAEAHQRLQQILQHVNMIWSAFQSEKFINEADAVLAYEEARVAAAEQVGGPRPCVWGGDRGWLERG